ncbi:hypothetical protein C1645_841557 [Glomus cerebriforme]|uniref:Uncharacterized protein n=1 Tax=Glomus cerebriforme TaxID=658196 RepID=A0A397S2Q1_9GLOM|nr:hypothetical protein C1645_841557 [Glomus cerebriforme]
MYNKLVAKNKCQYIEVDYNQGLDDTKKSNELFFLLKKLIEDKKKANKKKAMSKKKQENLNQKCSLSRSSYDERRVRRNKNDEIENVCYFALV